jgi:RNA polymerase sigma factor (sigma-70 family)
MTERPRSETSAAPGHWFTTTHWSVVLAAGDSASPQSTAALERLCHTYRYPLYAYIRRRGHKEHDAEDLTQGFFAHLLARHAFRGVMPGRAKFRTFLLTALNNFLADEHDWQQAQKRGGGKQIISFDAEEAEERYRLEPRHEETPEKLFDRRWALALLDGALARLEKEYRDSGKGPLFEQLRGSMAGGTPTQSYAEMAAQVGMTEEAVKKAAQRLRRRYQEVIREEIRETVADAPEIDEELRHLWSVLGT